MAQPFSQGAIPAQPNLLPFLRPAVETGAGGHQDVASGQAGQPGQAAQVAAIEAGGPLAEDSASFQPIGMARYESLLAGLHAAVAGLPQPVGRFAPPAPAGLRAGRLVQEAQFAVNNARDNAYEHRDDVKPEIGRYRTDCSGLVNFLIKQVDPSLLGPLRQKRPVARTYYRHFAAAPPVEQAGADKPWARVMLGAHIRPGDVIAREYTPPRPGATGHVLVATGYPQPVVRNGRVVAYDIEVVDDTRGPHRNDTRKAGGAGGVGRGTIAVLVDDQGRVTDYMNRCSASRNGGGPVAVGRINEPLAPGFDPLVSAVHPARFPAGNGSVVIPTDAHVASSAWERPGAPFTGRISRETLAALERAGGVSYVYASDFNGHREVVVHASPGFDPARPYSLLLYNRGMNGDNAASLEGNHIAQMVEELNREGRNILLVMPKSPEPMDAWFAPPEDAGAMLDQALGAFQANTGLVLGARAETLAMGFSAGGKSLLNLYTHPNPPHIDRFLLADSTYGNWAGALADAIERQAAAGEPAPAIAAVVTDHNRARAQQQLARRGAIVAQMPGSGRFLGHGGAPAHLLGAALGIAGGIGFSRYAPGVGWGRA